jgi:TRAP-type C4-dicarboxylate transport system permease small subunit
MLTTIVMTVSLLAIIFTSLHQHQPKLQMQITLHQQHFSFVTVTLSIVGVGHFLELLTQLHIGLTPQLSEVE